MEETNGVMEKKGTEGEADAWICGGDEDTESLRGRAQTFKEDNKMTGGRERGGDRERERWSGQESKPLTHRLGAAAAAVCVFVRSVGGWRHSRIPRPGQPGLLSA